MLLLELAFIVVVILEQIFIFIMEIFFSASSLMKKTLGVEEEIIKLPSYKVLMANQGLYNGVLAAGLIWGICSPFYSTQIIVFFLSCIIITAVVGGITTKKISIFFRRGIPALLALTLVIYNACFNSDFIILNS